MNDIKYFILSFGHSFMDYLIILAIIVVLFAILYFLINIEISRKSITDKEIMDFVFELTMFNFVEREIIQILIDNEKLSPIYEIMLLPQVFENYEVYFVYYLGGESMPEEDMEYVIDNVSKIKEKLFGRINRGIEYAEKVFPVYYSDYGED